MKKITLITALSAVVAGCTTTKVEPEQQVALALDQNIEVERNAMGVLGDDELPSKVTLLKAQKIALESNPTLEATLNRIASAKSRLQAAYSSYYPSISAYGAAGEQSKVSTNSAFPETDRYQVGLSASWLVFDGFSREAKVLAAKFDVLSQEEIHRDSQRLLINAVAISYYNVSQANKQMEISLIEKKINQEFLDETKAKRDAGTATDTDVFNFQVRVNAADINYLEYSRRFEISKVILAELLGMPGMNVEKEVEFELEKGLGNFVVGNLKANLTAALKNRPDLKNIQSAILQNKEKIAELEGSWYPTISLESSYGVNRDDNAHFDSDDQEFYYGVAMNWEIFNGFFFEESIKATESEVKAKLNDLQDTWNSIISQIRQDSESIKFARQRYKVQFNTVELNKKIYENTKLMYDVGTVNITRVNEVLTDLVVSQRELSNTRMEVLQSEANLRAATGTNLINVQR